MATYGQSLYGQDLYGTSDSSGSGSDVTASGSWWTLLDIAREHREWADEARLRGLTACPYDGEPLRTGAPQAPGVRHCTFCGRGFS
jgi:hypothetical protein